MTALAFTRPPIRAITVTGGGNYWTADYLGDLWTAPFRTEEGSLWLVLDALRYSGTRRGLPIIVHAEGLELAA